MKKYRCIKALVLDTVDGDGFETGDYEMVSVGSVWRLNNRLNYMGGENHLEDEDLFWIELSDKDLKEHFEKV